MTAIAQGQAEPGAALRMHREDLDRAAAAGVIGPEQADALWRFLGAAQAVPSAPRFDLVHVLWYAGALIVIGAMGWFTTLAFASLGGGALAVIAVTYAMVAAVFAEWSGARQGLGIYVLLMKNSFRTDMVLAAILLIAALSLVLFMLVGVVESLVVRWK